MLSRHIRILNFDDSVTGQKGLLSKYEAEIIDLRDLGRSARFWLNGADRLKVEERIGVAFANAVTFLGSGDFHHVTDILIRKFNEPVSVISFDFHPDWNILSPFLSCGSWLAHTIKNKNVLKCVLVGISSGDFSLSMHAGDFRSLKDDKIEIYPYSHKPSAIFFRNIPPNISVKSKKYPFFTSICWNELKNSNLVEFFLHVLRRFPAKKVYITVDKDCLGAADALTNWEEGSVPLEDLLLMLKLINENLEIVGMDITGDYSPVRLDGILKNTISYLNHPKNARAKTLQASSAAAVNERTNLRILDTLLA